MSKELTQKELAAMPFIRPGAVDLDLGYLLTIWDAKNRIALQQLIELAPHEKHDSPDGLMHYIPNKP